MKNTMITIQHHDKSLSALRISSLKVTLVLTMKLRKSRQPKKKKNSSAQARLTSKSLGYLIRRVGVLVSQEICYPYLRTSLPGNGSNPSFAVSSTGVLKVTIPRDSLVNYLSSQSI